MYFNFKFEINCSEYLFNLPQLYSGRKMNRLFVEIGSQIGSQIQTYSKQNLEIKIQKTQAV